ncbi:EthD domain-containing protein [Nocardia sp. CA-120079]|uniref:EthD domain-containing protein n=1 Tax=Nocardia sp. CA-120079 TaxID=3239974 RepID=UPI003D9857E1
MSINNTLDGAGSRRGFLTGATTAGLAAILASQLPKAAADPGSDRIKMVCALRRRADLSPEQFDDYWSNRHGPLATEQIKVLGGDRYVQSHITDAAQNLLLATTKGTGQAFDGLTEVWFPSQQAVLAALATTAGFEANQRLTDDEKNFLDLPRCSYFLTTERMLLG